MIKEKEALEASLSALSQPGATEEEKEEEEEVEGEGEKSFDSGEGEREGEEREAKSETEESDRDMSLVMEKKVLIKLWCALNGISSVVFFIKQSPGSASSSAASLRQQLATLTTSLQTLTAEKGKK